MTPLCDCGNHKFQTIGVKRCIVVNERGIKLVVIFAVVRLTAQPPRAEGLTHVR